MTHQLFQIFRKPRSPKSPPDKPSFDDLPEPYEMPSAQRAELAVIAKGMNDKNDAYTYFVDIIPSITSFGDG